MRHGIDILGFNHRLLKAERLVDARNPISSRNADIIKRFEEHCFSSSLSEARITKYVLTLKKLAGWLKKDFDEAGRNIIGRLVNQLERSEYLPRTKHDYKVVIKRFRVVVTLISVSSVLS